MLQGTCFQLLKNLQALPTDLTLPGALYSLSHSTKFNKGPVVGEPVHHSRCSMGNIGGFTLGKKHRPPVANTSLGEKGHIQVEMQSPGSLSSQKKKYSIIYSHKRFQACKEEMQKRSEKRVVVVSWKSA